ncbi:FG-GAP-like repeat-containing protein [Chitinophaga sp.]|uniref:FG-GAP-like repeat-containing protein n=1 Tax=Chitinophaga sp. TaxID=1869181 RepID=UPI0031D2A8BC
MFLSRIKKLLCTLALLPAAFHAYSQTGPFTAVPTAGFGNLNTYGGSTAWADYDNDSDLDVCIAGLMYGGGYEARIYRNNGNGTFTDIGANLSNTGANDSEMTIVWLDYDNDAQLDLLLLVGGPVILYRNVGGTFVPVSNTGLPERLSTGGAAAGDYDNDGYPDLAISGFDGSARVAKIYHNNRQGGFEETGTPLLAVSGGDFAWADYDKDGLLDLMMTGSDNSSSRNSLYRNLGNGNFSTGTMVGAYGFHYGSISWGDYDNDGYPDLLLSGFSTQHPNQYLTKIYRNNAGTGFTDINANLQGVSGSTAWGDYNNDGLLDIAAAGQTVWDPSTPQSGTYIYMNRGGNNFTLEATLDARRFSSASWADYNNDGRLDLLWIGSELSGSFACTLYRNTSAVANARPAAPTGLSHSISADEQSVTFTWQPATDAQTPAPGLHYNIYLYEDPGNLVKVNGYAAPGGYRRQVAVGNATQNTSYTFHGLAYDKVYRWSVQAIDAAWAGSAFPAEQSFATRKSQTIQLNDLTHQYGNPDFIPATLSSGLPLTIQLGNPSAAELLPDGKVRIKAVDTCSLIAYHHGNGEWLPVNVIQKTMIFTRGMLVVAADDKKITYGSPLPALTYHITGFAGSENESVLTQPVQISTTATGSSGAGAYPINASGAAAANYNFTYQQGTLTIEPKPLSIVLTPIADKVYGSADFTLNVQADPALPLTFSSSQPAVATIDAAGNIHITGTGTTEIAAMQQTGGNYLGDTALVTLRVTPASQTITFPAIAPKTFGDTDFDPQVQSSAGLPVQLSSSDVNVATITADGKIHITGTGTATITATQSGNANYNSATTTATLTVGKAAQTVTFPAIAPKTFGDADFDPQVESSTGLPVQLTSSDANIATIAADGKIHITGTGTATITATQSGNANYNSTTATAVLTVNKATQTITIDPLPAKTFGDADFTASAHASSGLPVTFSSSDPNVATVAANGTIHITGAGTVTITAIQAGNGNYLAVSITATLTISKAIQQITWIDLPVKTFGDADFPAGAAASSGLPVEYASSDANVATVNAAGQVHITGAGTVTITATQSGNGNYSAAATLSKQLVVRKAQQTITFGPLAPRNVNEPPFNPGATASSGLPVTYEIENTNLATASNELVTPLRAGITSITARQAGNANFEAAVAVTQTLEIVSSGQEIKVSDAITPNGDGINDFLQIEGLRNFPDNEMHIANATGRIVFEAKPYRNDFKGYANSGGQLLPKGVYYYMFFYTSGGTRKKVTGFFVLEY